MKLHDLFEDGRVVRGVNTTCDVGPNEIAKQAAKFGSKVSKDGVPPTFWGKPKKKKKVLESGRHGIIGPYEATGSLWHGTDILSLASILEQDRLMPSIDQDHRPALCGVSLTTDERMAWSFADRASYIFGNNHGHDAQRQQPELFNRPFPSDGAVLEFDAERLKRDYKLVHYVDDGMEDEQEIRAICKTLAPLSKYLVSVKFDKNDLDWFLSYCRSDEAASQYTDPSGLAADIERLRTRHLSESLRNRGGLPIRAG